MNKDWIVTQSELNNNRNGSFNWPGSRILLNRILQSVGLEVLFRSHLGNNVLSRWVFCCNPASSNRLSQVSAPTWGFTCLIKLSLSEWYKYYFSFYFRLGKRCLCTAGNWLKMGEHDGKHLSSSLSEPQWTVQPEALSYFTWHLCGCI